MLYLNYSQRHSRYQCDDQDIQTRVLCESAQPKRYRIPARIYRYIGFDLVNDPRDHIVSPGPAGAPPRDRVKVNCTVD